MPNFIPIGFETTEPWGFWGGRPNNNNNNNKQDEQLGLYEISSWSNNTGSRVRAPPGCNNFDLDGRY